MAAMTAIWTSFQELMERGGVVMWPLLALSMAAVTLAVERAWYWGRTNHPARLARVTILGQLLRRGDLAGARHIAESDRSVYGRVVRMLLQEGVSDAVATEAIESSRPALERFMATLSTIITAAPMLGILGTVLGIISSFNLLADRAMSVDPRAVSAGIAEALLTTVAGLVVALFALLPYNACRAQIDRTFGRIESLIAAAARGQALQSAKPAPPQAADPPATTSATSPARGG